MVYLAPFVRATWKFTIAGSDEIAETTVAIDTVDALDFVNAFRIDQNVGSAFITHMTNLMNGGVRWADYSRLAAVKVAPIGVDGSYIGEPAEFIPASTIQGTFPSIPPQLSVVMSLRAASTIGEATKGRMYLPHTTWPMDLGTWFATPTALGTQATALFNFVENMNTTCDLVEASSGLVINSKKGTGAEKRIVAAACRVGNLVDTQRRRRNRLPEIYQTD